MWRETRNRQNREGKIKIESLVRQELKAGKEYR
jgi:hypothetical protein